MSCRSPSSSARYLSSAALGWSSFIEAFVLLTSVSLVSGFQFCSHYPDRLHPRASMDLLVVSVTYYRVSFLSSSGQSVGRCACLPAFC